MSNQEKKNKCPVIHSATAIGAELISQWWPDQLNLAMLHHEIDPCNPFKEGYSYEDEVNSLDVNALKAELIKLMTTSTEFWPADWGHYGPLFIRMAWHSAGTYRISDGRGGASRGEQRFAPVNSWPDNANLDKARRLLWPIKKKYGKKLSWADLIVFAGNTALEAMGLRTIGFAFGRQDIWEPKQDTYWGPEHEWLADERHLDGHKLMDPFAAVQMGLIYVNPEGPNGEPDPLAAAKDIRETFSKMAMNDEETVALIAGGHTFGKTHGNIPTPEKYIGTEPEAAPIENQGLGWKNSYETGKGPHTWTSGLEGAWTNNPTKWDNGFFENLFKYDWVLTTSESGAKQWVPSDPEAAGNVVDPFDASKTHFPVMLTTDIALKVDPIFKPIAKRFYENPDQFEQAFARAWFKLIHRDLGPVTRYRGPLVPNETFLWQDPLPERDYELVDQDDIEVLKKQILSSQLSVGQLVKTAWASAVTYRGTDRRGGANGARIRLEPQVNWEVNEPNELRKVLDILEKIQNDFLRAQRSNKKISLADLIVLGGCTAVEKAARDAGFNLTVPFNPGRVDATQDQTDVESFKVLEPSFDGFRNYLKQGINIPAEHLLIERAARLTLTAPEMTVLLGGLRVLGCNYKNSNYGVFTDRVGLLTNDFFVNLLDLNLEWISSTQEGIYHGKIIGQKEVLWEATRVDLVFGANSQLRAIAETYATDDSNEKFVKDFIAAWTKVMELDRFDLHN